MIRVKKVIGAALCLALICLCAFALADVAINRTNFPDPYFRDYARAFDEDGDGKLSKKELAAVEGLYMYTDEVTSLKGIEYFTSVKDLDCRGCKITSLDLSRNTVIERVWVGENRLTSLKLGGTSLTDLEVAGNRLKNLDVSRFRDLEQLDCSDNLLTGLDVSKNTALRKLYCGGNGLTVLDVSRNTRLGVLHCAGNRITRLDIRRCGPLNRLVKEETPRKHEDYGLGWWREYDEYGAMESLFADKGVRIVTNGKVKSVTLDRAKATLVRTSAKPKPSLQLAADVLPATARSLSVKWTSSNPAVARVSAGGKVTALKAGKAVITSRARDGSGASASCRITVEDRKVTKITLNAEKMSLREGKTFRVRVKSLKPADALVRDVKWTSSNPAVAAVDEKGVVTALKKGTCTITCAAADGSRTKAVCRITVK